MNTKIVLIMVLASLPLFFGACLAGKKYGKPENSSESNLNCNLNMVNISEGDLISIEWMDQSGRKEVIQKEDLQWYYAGMEQVDFVSFNQYLNTLAKVEATQLSHFMPTQELDLLEKITLFGSSMRAPIVITAFKNGDVENQYIIHSSLINESYFISDSSGIYRDIFKDLRQFWPDGQ